MRKKSVCVYTRLSEDIFKKIETFALSKRITVSSVISELVMANFNLEITVEELEVFKKVSTALMMQTSKGSADDYYFSKIGAELINNLSRNDDGSYKRTKTGMYYFSDTELLRDLVTEYLEQKNDA